MKHLCSLKLNKYIHINFSIKRHQVTVKVKVKGRKINPPNKKNK